MSFDKLPLSWFDALLVIVLGFGLWRGRRNGMTKEVMPMLQWLALVLACGYGYVLVAPTFTNTMGTGELVSDLLGYLTVALVVFLVFAMLKRIFVPLLTGSNFFGSAEYYLGMFSGMVRFACLLVIGLALLNAPVYSQAEIKAHNDYMKRWFGGGMYDGNYFPDVHTVQESIFKKSIVGPYLKDYLGPVLIETTAPAVAKPPVKKQPVIHMGN